MIDHGQGMIPADPASSLRTNFREWILPGVFRDAVRDSLNRTPSGDAWLTEHQLDDLRDQLLRQPNRTLLEANETSQALLFKAQVDVNELTGESDPVAKLIDFSHPERNQFHAINQFRLDTPGCVKSCIIPDIVLFVNGIPLVIVEAKIGDANTANPLHAAFEQLLRYRNGRSEIGSCRFARASRAIGLYELASASNSSARTPSPARSPGAMNTSTLGRTSGRRRAVSIHRRSVSSASRSS